MSRRPDIATALAEGERLIWQGHPKPGRPTPLRANLLAALLYLATGLLALLAWYLEIYWGYVPALHYSVYLLIAAAALCTFLGFKLTLLDRRRARARDAQTAYAITDRRALVLAGPYRAELPLAAGLRPETRGHTLLLTHGATTLRFERLDDARQAREIVARQIEGGA